MGIRVAGTYDDINDTINTLMTSSGFAAGEYDWTPNPLDVSLLETGDALTITVTADYEGSSIELIGIPLIPVPATLHRTFTMAKE